MRTAAATWDPLHPDLWPAGSQRQLLRALLLEGEPASAAWRDWIATHDPECVDDADRALFPSVYLAAARLGIEPPARAMLRQAYMATWARNRTALSLLWRVALQLEAAGIPMVCLKGVPLLLFYYGDVGARTMADVDILVRPDDLSRAAEVLRASGWTPENPVPPRQVADYRHALAWQHEIGFDLDLHWRPFTPDCRPEPEERFWQRTEVRRYDGVRVRVPAAADLLVLMCFHGRKQDRLAKGRWVIDVMRVVARDGGTLDWDLVARECIATGLCQPVHDALSYLRSAFAVPVPEEVLRRLADLRDRPDRRMRYFELARGSVERRGLSEILAGKWWRYAGVRYSRDQVPSWHGFLSYYLADRQWEWRLDHRWQVPVRALSRAVARLRSHGL